MTKQKIPQIGIRWKLVTYLAVFVSILLLVLWLFQIVFLGDVYRNIKVNEIFTAAEAIKSRIETVNPGGNAMAQLTESISADNQICISVLDDSFRAVGGGTRNTCYSIGAANNCFVHQSSGTLLSDMIRFQFLATVRQSGEVYFRDMSPNTAQTQSHAPDGITFPTTPQNNNPDRETAMLYVEYFEHADNGYYIILNSKVTPVSSTVQTLQYELVIISILFIVAAIIMALVLSYRISAPIIQINKRAHQLATGDYNTVFEGSGYKEIAELRDTLNYAAKELSKVEGFRRELIANVSHDLRTPLTMITGYAEVMRDLPGENTPENVQVIIDEGSRLTTLVNDLLDLSKLQSGTAPLSMTTFSLTECVKTINRRYQKLKENDGYDIDFLYDEDVFVTADYPKLGQVIYNLVNNAISYTGTDKKVTIRQTVTETNGIRTVRISVTDTGMGISRENLEYIWDRYFKENKSHKRAVVGTGLGLSIVKSILQMHHARFGVDTSEDEINHGSTFWFELVCAEAPTETE
ncbi:MAG: HAMP domain-containing histidine kinase [Ruminococcaceae bacterium]|nr:HAMP domain-containing histidine kinase [Oscillospiraceae bacterium]